MTSRQMADICGVEEKTFSAYLTGQNLIKPMVAARIIRAFPKARIDFNWLYQGEPGGLAHDFALKIEAANSSRSNLQSAEQSVKKPFAGG